MELTGPANCEFASSKASRDETQTMAQVKAIRSLAHNLRSMLITIIALHRISAYATASTSEK